MGRGLRVVGALVVGALLVVALTPVGVADYWHSQTARDIDAALGGGGAAPAGGAVAPPETETPTASPATRTTRRRATSAAPATETPVPTTRLDPDRSRGDLTEWGLVHVAPGAGRINETRVERLVYRGIEDERGRRPLHADDRLANVSRFHSREMGRRGATFHVADDGETLRDRLERFGADCVFAQEVVASEPLFGTDDSERAVAAALVDEWASDDDARETLMNLQFTRAGVGVWIVEADDGYRLYATTVFCGGSDA